MTSRLPALLLAAVLTVCGVGLIVLSRYHARASRAERIKQVSARYADRHRDLLRRLGE